MTQRGADRVRKGHDVDADLTLVDRRFFVVVIEFDRVLDRDDVVVDVGVQVVDARGQGRRFAGTRRAGDEDQPPGTEDQVVHDRRRAELLHRKELGRNLTQNQPGVPLLLENRYTETRLGAEREPEVGPPALLQLLLAPLRGDALHQ